MTIKEKIQKYLECKGITPTAAERKLGWGVGAFTKAKSVTSDRAKEFLLLYGDLSAEWLFRDIGDMIITSAKNNQTVVPPDSSTLMIPFEEYRRAIAEKDEIIKEQAYKIGRLEQELQPFAPKEQNVPGTENASIATAHQINIPKAE